MIDEVRDFYNKMVLRGIYMVIVIQYMSCVELF